MASPTSAPQAADLQESYQSLQKYLANLEVENQKLAREMEEKRRVRLERLQQGPVASFQLLRQRLRKAEDRTRQHQKALQFLRAFLKKNTRLLRRIAMELQTMQKEFSAHSLPVEGSRARLVSLLSELQTMKEHRQRILDRTRKS